MCEVELKSSAKINNKNGLMGKNLALFFINRRVCNFDENQQRQNQGVITPYSTFTFGPKK
jgi:hypothetical protein